MVTTEATDKLPALADLNLLDRYWRAANYLSVGQIYLLDNPLLREQLLPEHVKPRLLGHFGTTPGLNLLYAHLNRLIKERDLSVLFVTGPGHGCEHLPRGHVLRGLSGDHQGRGGLAPSVQTVLVPWRDPESCRARNAR